MNEKRSTRYDPVLEKATFAGGCFWCMVTPFEQFPGIYTVLSGYTGGCTDNPTYEQVCTNSTGHVEAVQITFDATVFPYVKLLNIFWQQIDPTDAGGQFHDRGSSYRTAIFYHHEEQHKLAEQSKQELEQSGRFNKPIVTKILPACTFFPAEKHHQNYHLKNPLHYKRYRSASGRDTFIVNHWGVTKQQRTLLREQLTPLQYRVTQQNGTEPPFANEYWDHKEEGIYVDIISGEPLFSSIDKFDAGCGWPAFSKPLCPNYIEDRVDKSHGMVRVEVRSKLGDSHLGHVFDDGPKLTELRYCINSAALRFIPKERLKVEGYGEFTSLFSSK